MHKEVAEGEQAPGLFGRMSDGAKGGIAALLTYWLCGAISKRIRNRKIEKKKDGAS